MKYNVCACLGAMYGEPHCPCVMRQMGLQEFMDNNPVRKAAEEKGAENYKKFLAEGGWEKLFGERKDELED